MKYTVQIFLFNLIVYPALAYLAHVLGPNNYGQLIYVVGVTSSLVPIAIFGRTEFELRHFYSTPGKLNAAPLLFSAIIFSVLAALFWFEDGQIEWQEAALALMLGFLIIVSEYLSLILRIREKFGTLAMLGKPVNIFYLGLCVVLLAGGAGANMFMFAAGMLVVYLILFFYYTGNQIDFRWGGALRFDSMPFWINSVLFALYIQSATFILGYFDKLAEVGEFSIAFVVVNVGTFILSAFFSVYLQGKFYAAWNASQSTGLRLLAGYLIRASALGLALAVSAAIAIVLVYPLMYNLHNYPDLITLSELMVLIVLVRSLQSPLSLLMNVEGFIRFKNIATFGSYGLAGLVSFITVPRYGVYGAFLGMLIGEICLLLCFIRTFLKQMASNQMFIIDEIYDGIIQAVAAIVRFLRERHVRRRPNAAKLSFAGYYGFGNFGDDLFIQAIHQAMMRREDAKERHPYVFLCSPISGVGREFFPSNSDFVLARSQQDDLLGAICRAIIKIRAACLCGTIVHAGGSLFSSLSPSRLLLERILMESGVAFYGIGISVGPFKDEREAGVVLDHLRKFKRLVVRDKRSLEILQKNDIQGKLLPDIVFSVDFKAANAHLPAQVNRKPMVMVVLAPVEGELIQLQEKFYGSVLGHAHKAGWEIVFASFQKNDIEPLSLPDGLNSICVHYDGNFEVFSQHLLQCDYLITSRLHGGIAAAAIGKPFYMFQHHPKIGDFLSSIDWPYCNGLCADDFLNHLHEIERAMPSPIDTTVLRSETAAGLDEALNIIINESCREVLQNAH